MSRVRGVAVQREFAKWLTAWWPHAESAGSGRQGRDVLGTPGVAFEVKTAQPEQFRPGQWVRQAIKNAGGDIPVVVWFPPGIGIGSVDKALAMLPATVLLDLLDEAGHVPGPYTRQAS